MRVVHAKDQNGNILLDQSVEALRLNDEAKKRLDDRVEVVRQMSFQELRRANILSDLDKSRGPKPLMEIKFRANRTDYRIAAYHTSDALGDEVLLVGSMVSREPLNAPSRKANTVDRLRAELDTAAAEQLGAR
jgi:hypothetical protein